MQRNKKGGTVEDNKRLDELLDMFEKKLTLDENAQKWGVGAPCEIDEGTPESDEDGADPTSSTSNGDWINRLIR